MPLRELLVSNNEHDFILGSIAKKIRLDERAIDQYRELSITFGKELGYCYVSLGSTKVLAQVAAEVDRPKESRPSEGRLAIHLEISTLAAGHLDPAKPGVDGVEIRQFLERSLLHSAAIDLEELCLRTGEKVWSIHLYLHVLDHDGNILDCASVAAITALRHFRRPSVLFDGRQVTVQSMEETAEPVALTINHMPFCCSFAFFEGGKHLVLDASSAEEKAQDGRFLVSMNKHRQICRMLMCGAVQIDKQQIKSCTNIAAVKVKDISDFVNRALETDVRRRANGDKHEPIIAEFVRKGGKRQQFGYVRGAEVGSGDEDSSASSDEEGEVKEEVKEEQQVKKSAWGVIEEPTAAKPKNAWAKSESKPSNGGDAVMLISDDEEEEVTFEQTDIGVFK